LVTAAAAAAVSSPLQACSRIFGYDKGELDGKNVSNMM
jgi:hypothetical protein